MYSRCRGPGSPEIAATRPIADILIAPALLTVALNLYKTIATPEPAQE